MDDMEADWKQYWSEKRRRIYFYNAMTKQSTWTLPRASLSSPARGLAAVTDRPVGPTQAQTHVAERPDKGPNPTSHHGPKVYDQETIDPEDAFDHWPKEKTNLSLTSCPDPSARAS